MKTKNIIISGGAGFIGINLIDHLTQQENVHKIIVIDNFVTSDKNRFLSLKNDKIILFEADICDIDLKTQLDRLHIYNIDEIYHLASLASPPAYKKHPLKTLDVGYIGTKYLLHLAIKIYDAKILFASTSEIYGDALVSPQNETYFGNVNAFGERSCYDESKRIGETLCYTFHKEFGANVKIARIFNTYGPYMMIDDGRIITEVIKNLMNNTNLIVYGNGTQTRSFCYIDDTIKMLVRLMASDVNVPVNIGNDSERTINNAIATIENIWNKLHNTDTKLLKTYLPLTENDPLQRKPCLELNKKLLGEHTYTTFEEGIKKTIEYFVSNQSVSSR
jgi:nucleoside-diphosphate-sugar epimerase